MNICWCGGQEGYCHAADCPRPLYRATPAQSAEWWAARFQLQALHLRQARYEHLCELFNVQDREKSEEGYTAADWAEYQERTHDEAERRVRQ